jgi:hypothetical protein
MEHYKVSTVTRVLLDDMIACHSEELSGFDIPFFKDWYVNVKPGGRYKKPAKVQEQNVRDDVEVITGRIAISL